MPAAASQPVPTSAAQPYDRARWAAIYARISLEEGDVFTNDPADPGGATKDGVSLRFLAADCKIHPDLIARYDIDNNHLINVIDIKGLSVTSAAPLFCAEFYIDTGFFSLPQPFDAALTDEAVNAGPVAAVKLLQRALNSLFRPALFLEALAEDGQLGQASRGRLDLAISRLGQGKAIDAYRAEAAGRYSDLVAKDHSLQRFLNGWLNRAASLGDV